MKLILGSSSKWRRQVMLEAGLACDLMSPDIDEKAIRHTDPETLVRLISKAKSEALRGHVHEDALIITADQVVDYEGSIREKPESKEESRIFLESYSERSVDTVSGVGVYNTKNNRYVEGFDRVTIEFNKIPEDVIAALVEEEQTQQTAGGFSIEHPLLQPYVREIRGSVDSVWGLPMLLVKRLMEEVLMEELTVLSDVEDERGKEFEYFHRKAARAVLFDEEGHIPLLYVKKYDYYKLPGGGLEGSEDMHEALIREVMEEVGATCAITHPIGMIREYRKEYKMYQDSYCFLGTVLEKGSPQFTEKELEEGFELQWLSPKEALEKFATLPENYQGRFIVERDRVFLEKAMKMKENIHNLYK